MKILHCCLAQFYIDDFSYQENILPKMHKLQGHDVAIIASTETYIGTKLGYVLPSSYFTKESIPITRLGYVKWLPHPLVKKLRIYNGLKDVIMNYKPDIIFIHDCQFISIATIAHYAKKHSVKIYVDGHTDFINSGKNWISKNILHKIIYRWCAHKIEPFTSKFYGVLPIRVDFYKDVYKISPNKIELLPLGSDHSVIDLRNRESIKADIRTQLDIKASDFVIVTGGKLDRRKNIHVLMRAVNELEINDIILLIFGTPTEEMIGEITELSKSVQIRYTGWVPSGKIPNYLLAADIAMFPGTHSVLWEQSVGLGIPCIFKRWDGIQHVDVGGNCLFLESDNVTEIKQKILEVYNNRELLESMILVSRGRGILKFSYEEIAKRAIEQ